MNAGPPFLIPPFSHLAWIEIHHCCSTLLDVVKPHKILEIPCDERNLGIPPKTNVSESMIPIPKVGSTYRRWGTGHCPVLTDAYDKEEAIFKTSMQTCTHVSLCLCICTYCASPAWLPHSISKRPSPCQAESKIYSAEKAEMVSRMTKPMGKTRKEKTILNNTSIDRGIVMSTKKDFWKRNSQESFVKS